MMMTIIDFQAAKKWVKLPTNMQRKLLHNVFCVNCGLATISEYALKDDTYGIVVEASCDKCGSNVVRAIEMQ